MGRQQFKRDIRKILSDEDFISKREILETFPEHIVVNLLFTSLCDPDAKVRANAVTAFGWLIPRIADRDMEAARIIMRRCLWSMNDESGGIGWGIPETMAEVMCYHTQLRQEYLHMLISYMREDGDELYADGNYLELPMLQRGLLWGIGKLCQLHAEEMNQRGVFNDVAEYLKSSDTTVVGLAIIALGQLGNLRAISLLASFIEDERNVVLFERGRNVQTPLAALAQTTVNRLQVDNSFTE